MSMEHRLRFYVGWTASGFFSFLYHYRGLEIVIIDSLILCFYAFESFLCYLFMLIIAHLIIILCSIFICSFFCYYNIYTTVEQYLMIRSLLK